MTGSGASIIAPKIGAKFVQEVKAVAMAGEKLHHLAAKCGVFAETDIVNLIKSSISKVDILNSL